MNNTATIVLADRRRDVPRKETMLARRIRQRSRKAGFTPIRNERISKRVEALTTLLTAGYVQNKEKYGTAVPSAVEIEREAWRNVARTLPALPIGVRVRAYA